MVVNWQEVVTTVVATVGGGGVALGAAAWLVKAIVTDRMARDAETFRAGLQTAANTEIETLKHALQMTALEHQVRFSKLHERQAEVIAEVYTLLVQLHVLGERFALDDVFADTPRDVEAFERVLEAGRKLNLLVQMNRLYLPENVCASVETFKRAVTEKASIVQGASTIAPRLIGSETWEPSAMQREFRTKMFHKAWEAFEKEIPATRKLLENEFRELLGGAKNSISKPARQQESTERN
jgi:hypothetical protein